MRALDGNGAAAGGAAGAEEEEEEENEKEEEKEEDEWAIVSVEEDCVAMFESIDSSKDSMGLFDEDCVVAANFGDVHADEIEGK